MAKKQMLFKTKGMNRDLSVSAFNPEFSYENMNLRLSTNEGNTLMSWVNEKGTELIKVKDSKNNDLTLNGCVIGTAIINQYLVLFLTKGWDSTNNKYFDSIYRLEYLADKKSMEATKLYSGQLGFSIEHPLETHVSYESKDIQKVYWTDGINQPRLINIAPDNDKRIPTGDNSNGNVYNDTSFDFIPTLKLEETIKVQKVLGGGGMFAPGVIQYAFTYYRKYGQESNIFYTTPLYYISHADRGASPEEKVDNIFKITIENVDKDNNFDYLRIYSIQRTSINGTPICKRIQDIALEGLEETSEGSKKYKASYTDTGLNGNAVDPMELLYIGGVSMLAGTMEQKDNTLFMGDLTIAANLKPKVVNDITLKDATRTFYPTEVSTKNYVYANQLTAFKQSTKEESVPCAGFKYGNYYRCGVQFQDKTGKWSDPIFIDNHQVTAEPSIKLKDLPQTDPGSTPKDPTPVDPTPILPTQDLNIVVSITNSSTNALIIENGIKFGFEDGTLMDVRLSSSSPVKIASGVTTSFNAYALSGSDYEDKYFASSSVIQKKGWHNNVLVYDINHGNVNNYDFQSLSSTEKFKRNKTYSLVCTKSPSDQPSPTPSANDVPVTISLNNSSANNLTIQNIIKFGFSNGERMDITLSSTSPVYVRAGETKIFNATAQNGENFIKDGLTFASEAVCRQQEWNNNVFIYDLNHVSDNYGMDALSSTDKFEKNRTYNLKCNTSPADQPQPTPGPSGGNPIITFNVNIINNTGSAVTLDGFMRFFVGNPDHNGRYCGWDGVYNSSERATFSPTAVTLAVGGSQIFSVTPVLGDTDGLGEKSPLSPDLLYAAERSRNVCVYVGGNSEAVYCENLSPSIIFTEGGKYDIILSNTTAASRSASTTRSMTRGGDLIDPIEDDPETGGDSTEGGSTGGTTPAATASNPAKLVPSSPMEISVPIIKGTIDSTDVLALYKQGYRKARAVVVYPNLNDRVVLCQGVACPTVYTINHRGSKASSKEYTKDLYAQSSWFFRPYYSQDSSMVTQTVNTPYGGNNYLFYQGSGIYDSPNYIKRVEIQGNYSNANKFSPDWNTVTLHSPEIEFDSNMYNIDYDGSALECHKRGTIGFTRTFSDIDIQTETPTISAEGGGFVKKSFTEDYSYGIIAGLFYDDFVVDDKNDPKFEPYDQMKAPVKWMVYPWHRTGALNNDINRPVNAGTTSAVLKKKIISNLRYAESHLSEIDTSTSTSTSWNCSVALFSSDQPTIIKLKTSEGEADYANVYQGNIDTLLIADDSDGSYFACKAKHGIQWSRDTTDFTDEAVWKTFLNTSNDSDYGLWNYGKKTGETAKWRLNDKNTGKYFKDMAVKKDSVRMKYKSTPHLVLKGSSSLYEYLNDNFTMPIMELRRSGVDAKTLFGGESSDALKANIWIPCGEPVSLWDGSTDEQGKEVYKSVDYFYEYGDTYYQRWDCLKTYAFTPEDINQVVEIGSFMLETYVNIDGRYDRNRGQLSNLYMSPQNFNLLNPVYSQLNNFFTYRIQDEDANKEKHFPNQITWSKTKTSGADVDLWTNVTLASILELDGDKGKVRRFARFNDKLLCFQDTAVAQILYNENTMLSTTEGVPVEIGNSGKVQGKGYISDSIGCSNKWSVCSTPSGIYFMDSYNKAIYMYNGQLNSLSASLGMNTWCKNNIPDDLTIWTPSDYLEDNGTSGGGLVDGFQNFVTYNDKLNRDILFINKTTALTFSEGVGTFTSFYDYGKSPYFCNFSDTGVWARVEYDRVGGSGSDESPHMEYITSLWRHQTGDYCKFFGELKPYWMTMIANPEPLDDKIFTNLEFRASVDGDGEYDGDTGKFTPTPPFDSLETWNEYQHGYTTLENKNGHSLFQHGGDSSALIRKFRIWRNDIPRNNCLLGTPPQGTEWPYSTDAQLGISRHIRKLQDRMRNPWLYIKLKKRVEVEDDSLPRAELHDLVITYFK